MSDLTLNFEGVSPEVATVLQSEAAMKVITAAIDAAKAPLVAKRDELLASLTDKTTRLKSFDDIAAQAAASKAALALSEAEKNGDAEKLKTYYSEQLSSKDKELTDLRASIVSEKVQNKLHSAIREAKGSPELLESHLRGRIKAEMVNGQLTVSVLTANGLPALNADGKDASLSDLLSEFKSNPTFGRAFDAPQAAGAGTKASGATSSNNPWAPANKSVTNQMALYKQDKALAIRMAAEHGVKLA